MKPNNAGLTSALVRELLDYDPATGILRWRRPAARNVKAGSIAGHLAKDGYVKVKINNREHGAHRVAWLHFYGQSPAMYVDHVNRSKSDNRIVNLREATPSLNTMNSKLLRSNTSGFRGVFPVRRRFGASIVVNKQRRDLGRFATAEAASAAYERARAQLAPGV